LVVNVIIYVTHTNIIVVIYMLSFDIYEYYEKLASNERQVRVGYELS